MTVANANHPAKAILPLPHPRASERASERPSESGAMVALESWEVRVMGDLWRPLRISP